MQSKFIKMKKFDLEKAKNGSPICTMDGRDARIICTDFKNEHCPLVVLVDDGISERIYIYTNEGIYLQSFNDDLNLCMKPKKHTGWINIYLLSGDRKYASAVFSSEDEAKKDLIGNGEGYLTTTKIEWEE